MGSDQWLYQTDRKLAQFGGRNLGAADLRQIVLLGRDAVADERFFLDRHCPLLMFFIAAMLGFSAPQLPNRGAHLSDDVSPLLSAVYFCFGIYPPCWGVKQDFRRGLIIHLIQV